MSLEVKVFKEISSYQPKVMWGMSWRQIATAAVAIPVLAGTYAAFYKTGNADIGEWVVVILTIPFALFGWVRPLGLHFETWAKYVFTAYQTNQKLTYHHHTHVETPKESSSNNHDEPTHYKHTRKRRGRITETGQ